MDGVVVIPISGGSLAHHSEVDGRAPHPNPLPKGEGTGLKPLPKGEGTCLNPLPKGEGTLLGGFWVGPENRLVPGGIEAILERRSHGSGPVVFFGPCGSGKTHLALGSVSAYRTRYRQRSAAYATAVDFAREMADAIDTQTMDEFRQRYRRPSLLAIDDVDRLAGKEASERELASTLDSVLEARGQVLLTSSVAPGQLTGFLPQLQSRLMGGLTIPLALPGPETRVAIVRRLAEVRGIKLGAKEAETLALGLRSSVPRSVGGLGHAPGREPDGGRDYPGTHSRVSRRTTQRRQAVAPQHRHGRLTAFLPAAGGPAKSLPPPGRSRCPRRGNVPGPDPERYEPPTDRLLLQRPRPYHSVARLLEDQTAPWNRRSDPRRGNAAPGPT